jgi:RecA-family ATPase
MTQESADEGIEYGVFWGDSLFAHAKRKAPIIDHFLYVNDTIFINAQTGVGKSIFLLQMLASLTTGESFLGAFKIHGPKNVLLLQTEGDRVETLQRLNAIGRGVRIDHDRWVHVNLDGICLNTQQGLNDFMKMIEAPGINYDVVIIDPLYTTVKGSLSSDDVATDWIRSARAIRRKYQCAFAVSHHDTIKTQYYEGQVLQQSSKNLMGSSYWGAFTSYNFKLTLRNGIYTLTSGKERNPQVIDTIHMRLIEPDPLTFGS